MLTLLQLTVKHNSQLFHDLDKPGNNTLTSDRTILDGLKLRHQDLTNHLFMASTNQTTNYNFKQNQHRADLTTDGVTDNI